MMNSSIILHTKCHSTFNLFSIMLTAKLSLYDIFEQRETEVNDFFYITDNFANNIQDIYIKTMALISIL